MPEAETTRPMLGVVTPMANEDATVDEWVGEVLAHLEPGDLLFCVLDHESVDETRARVGAWSERDPRVRLIWAPENRSVVDAYFRGYREALAAGCEWILEMDAGFSHLPREIPRFIDAMERGADFAAGSRFMRGGRYVGLGKRWLISRFGSVVANVVLGTHHSDLTSGFECFTRPALEHVVARGTRSRAHFFQTEIRHMLRDWKCVDIPITYSAPSPRLGVGSLTDAIFSLVALRRERR